MKGSHTFSVTVETKEQTVFDGRAKLLPQYAGACSACLAAFSVGNVLAWTAPASPLLKAGIMGFPVSDDQNSWVGGLMPIGAAISCIPTGYSTDKLGRKATLLGLVPLFLLGWGLIIWATNVEMLYAGRFISGMCGGAVCVAAPAFTAEICQKEIRGNLGSYYQLLLASGIMFTYLIGGFLSIFWFSIISAMFPVLFGISFIFFPDTPVFYLIKGQPEKARASLKFFRGANYNVEPELCELAEGCGKITETDKPLLAAFTTKQAIRSTAISIGMMIFQQLSGVNAIIFYTTDIFRDAGSSLPAQWSTVLIGFMEVTSTLLVTFIADSVGRRILLVLSSAVMSLCTIVIGIYFHLKDNHHDVSSLGWLPLLSLCLFIVVFSIGYGPIPWALMPELLPSEIKGTAGSIACVINWLCAFLVTKFFADLVANFGSDVTFWIFAVVSAIGVTFSWNIPETKGKTFEEIQQELGGNSSNNNSRERLHKFKNNCENVTRNIRSRLSHSSPQPVKRQKKNR